MNKLAFKAVLALIMISCIHDDNHKVLINIPEVINGSPEEIESKLGKPDTAYLQPVLNEKVLTYVYTKNKVEFRFFDNRASEIIVRNPDQIPFNQSSLQVFGFKSEDPDVEEKNVMMKWEDKEGLKTISYYSKYQDNSGKPQIWEIFFKSKE